MAVIVVVDLSAYLRGRRRATELMAIGVGDE
jgi:hypothetical protein